MNSKRLSVQIPGELHQEIKISAAMHNITMATWILRAIIKERELEKSYE